LAPYNQNFDLITRVLALPQKVLEFLIGFEKSSDD